MSVLRDATYATLGARASLCTSRDTSSHFELAYDGVARRARPQTRTCICLFSSRRACAVSAFFAFGHLGPHMRLCARNGPFPRGFSSLAIFFYFFCRRHQPLEVPSSVRPHTQPYSSAYVSIRQRTSCSCVARSLPCIRPHTSC